MTEENAKRIGIAPFALSEDLHRKVTKVQAFLEATTGLRPQKGEACELLVAEGVKVYELKMDNYKREVTQTEA